MAGRPGILRSVLDRPRAVALGCSALCFALFALLTVAVLNDWQPLYDLDQFKSIVASMAGEAGRPGP